MTIEIPYYGQKAYALFYMRHRTDEEFGQSDLDWIVSGSMKKKIFSLLVRSGWLEKTGRSSYRCRSPEEAIMHLLEFRVQGLMAEAERPYAFTALSAVEIWSDYCYVQRSMAKSPYFMKVQSKDLDYWKSFFNDRRIPVYVGKGATIGEYVILQPVKRLDYTEIGHLKVEPLKATMAYAKGNPMYSYAYEYMKRKHGG